MVAAAVMAAAAMVAKWTRDRCLESGQMIEVLVAAMVGGGIGVGAMRHFAHSA